MEQHKPMRRHESDHYIWEIIHWLTMIFLGHRLTRGFDIKTGKFVRLYWDKASNWHIAPIEGGSDWVRKDVPFSTPIWESKSNYKEQ